MKVWKRLQLESRSESWENPRNIKVNFAQEIVARFHSQADAESALNDFQTRAKGGIPDDVPEVRMDIGSQSIGIAQLLNMPDWWKVHLKLIVRLNKAV